MSNDIPWNSEASLMRVIPIKTANDQQEELVARGTVYELVGQVLEMPADRQEALLLRAAGPDQVREFDAATIRELAARPEFTGFAGAYDSVGDTADEEGQAPGTNVDG